jgi:hypothetical protein
MKNYMFLMMFWKRQVPRSSKIMLSTKSHQKELEKFTQWQTEKWIKEIDENDGIF